MILPFEVDYEEMIQDLEPYVSAVFSYISSVIKDSPETLWEKCSDHSGVDEDGFKRYFKDKESGYALVIDSVESFARPLEPTEIIEDFAPPQSFYYLAKQGDGSLVSWGT